MGAEQEAIVRSLFDCLVAEDWDGAADHYAVDATHTNPAWREPIVGRAAIRVDEERTGSLYTNFRYRIVNMASTDSVVLTEPATKFVAEKFESGELASAAPNWFAQTMPVKKTITPPKWIGWSLLSVGGVMVLHSLAMRK